MKYILESPKLKIVAIILALTAIICASVSGSIAFFNDAKESTSIYTAGSVYIDLSEAATKADEFGNLVEDPDSDRIYGADINDSANVVVNDYGVVFPGQSIYKDPTITNTGRNSAWIAMKVIVKDGVGDIHRLFNYNEYYDDIDIEHFISGGLLEEQVNVGTWNGIEDVCYNDNYAMIQSSNRQSGVYEFFFIMLQPFKKGDSVKVFDTVFFDSSFGNEEMIEFKEFEITVQAFAVQKFGFSSCLDAMNGAFPEHFSNAVSTPTN